jgi:hypothetical protein
MERVDDGLGERPRLSLEAAPNDACAPQRTPTSAENATTPMTTRPFTPSSEAERMAVFDDQASRGRDRQAGNAGLSGAIRGESFVVDDPEIRALGEVVPEPEVQVP